MTGAEFKQNAGKPKRGHATTKTQRSQRRPSEDATHAPSNQRGCRVAMRVRDVTSGQSKTINALRSGRASSDARGGVRASERASSSTVPMADRRIYSTSLSPRFILPSSLLFFALIASRTIMPLNYLLYDLFPDRSLSVVNIFLQRKRELYIRYRSESTARVKYS